MIANPFTSKQIQPGARLYLFPKGVCLEEIADRMGEEGQCYLIVGPHGTGKSTLLHSLLSYFQERYEPSELEVLYLQPRKNPSRMFLNSVPHWKHKKLVFIDGMEQLPMILRWYLRRCVRKFKIRSVGTCHRPLRNYRAIWQSEVDLDIERRVLADFLSDYPERSAEALMASQAWLASRANHGQNLRETLFDMYDWWKAEEGSSGIDSKDGTNK